MARSINRLSARAVSTLAKQGLHADGGGLYLQVSRFDTKSWIFRFTLNKKTRDMGLGPLHTISLAEAREEALQCRKMVRDGIDPIGVRRELLAKRLNQASSFITFRQCAEAYISSHSAAWKNVKHSTQWHNTLNTYVYPVFGDLSVQSIDVGLVLKVLEPIWQTKTETASRVRGRIESVLDWAATRKYRKGENPARWKGHLDKLLPQKSKIQKVKHHEALPYADINPFLVRLRLQNGISAFGLEFLILTATRTSEVMKASWSEIDLDAKVWTIPADRMKSGKEHRVPLSLRAIELLGEVGKFQTGEFVFPGQKPKSSLSNMAFLQLLKRMGERVTAHGFRSTFRDWAAEQTMHSREVVEMALAHAIGNKVEEAYRRGDLFEKRKRLMVDWAVYCDQVLAEDSADVVPISG
ncbi:MAG: tyrosine-type recombinase/integrase [Alphaproteobacteria bacterium]|jgi:integrase|nr:tyrosine-type recombinase/integrase [Alphaproteobacteria bacterium]MBT4543199.1 tyrosine-type recombinase/integrase [Alphaproteobacteria bacterium]